MSSSARTTDARIMRFPRCNRVRRVVVEVSAAAKICKSAVAIGNLARLLSESLQPSCMSNLFYVTVIRSQSYRESLRSLLDEASCYRSPSLVNLTRQTTIRRVGQNTPFAPYADTACRVLLRLFAQMRRIKCTHSLVQPSGHILANEVDVTQDVAIHSSRSDNLRDIRKGYPSVVTTRRRIRKKRKCLYYTLIHQVKILYYNIIMG